MRELGIPFLFFKPHNPADLKAARAITDRVCDDEHPSLFREYDDWGLRGFVAALSGNVSAISAIYCFNLSLLERLHALLSPEHAGRFLIRNEASGVEYWDDERPDPNDGWDKLISTRNCSVAADSE